MKNRLLLLTLCIIIGLSFPPSANAEEIAGFSDVDENAVYAEAIRWAEEQGYVNGYPDEIGRAHV